MRSMFQGFCLLAAIAASVVVAGAGLAVGPAAGHDSPPDRPRPAVRIVGGERAPTTSAPWMVALGDRRVPNQREGIFCGGVLVGADWVVTAEHCIWGLNRKRLEVFPGAVNLRTDREGGIGVRGIRRPRIQGLDVVMLHLDARSGREPLGIADRLPDPGSVATALGWGSLGAGGQGVNRLRQVEIPVRTVEECRAAYFGAFDPETMLCAGTPGRDTCSGDSGGPLISEGQLIGITSFGRGCGSLPGVYARVDGLANWIETSVYRDRLRHGRAAARAKSRASAKARARQGRMGSGTSRT